jgi:hypothetical protein
MSQSKMTKYQRDEGHYTALWKTQNMTSDKERLLDWGEVRRTYAYCTKFIQRRVCIVQEGSIAS